MIPNGPKSKIYHLKPVYQLPTAIETNCSMYKMKNLHEQPVTTKRSIPNETKGEKSIINQANSLSDEDKLLSKVLKKQEDLIKHLKDIQNKVIEINQELSQPPAEKLSSSKKKKNENTDSLKKVKIEPMKSKSYNVSNDENKPSSEISVKDMVINLTPHRPAYSLLTLPHIWKKQFSANFSVHTQSSVKEVPHAFNVLSQNNVNKENTLFDIRVIWKDVPDTELIRSPIKNIPILGEVNMLRLFNRMLSNVDDAVVATQIDSVLDTCHQLLHTEQKHQVFVLVKKLNDHLGQNEWMLGSNQISIVDAAAWSAILNSTRLNQLSQNLVKWVNKINALVGISNEQAFKSK